MSRTFKATNIYGSTWKKVEEKISESIEDKKIPFFINELSENLEKALKDVEVDDVLDATVGEWKKDSPTQVKDFSPWVSQGMHGGILEKSLKKRYRPQTVEEIYSKAEKLSKDISEYMQRYKDEVKEIP